MYIIFLRKVNATLHQIQHLEERIEDFVEDVITYEIPHSQHYLFDVNDLEKISEEKHIIIHSILQFIVHWEEIPT